MAEITFFWGFVILSDDKKGLEKSDPVSAGMMKNIAYTFFYKKIIFLPEPQFS